MARSISIQVFGAAFDADDGGSLYRRYLALKLAGDPEVVSGDCNGDSDIMSWIRNDVNIPLGWSEHVFGVTA